MEQQQLSENIVGVFGTGSSTRKHTVALLNDWHDANKITSVVVSGNEAEFTDAPRHAADWALAELGADSLIILVDDEAPKAELDDYTAEGVKVRLAPVSPVETALERATHIFVAFPDEDSAGEEKIAEDALRLGKHVFDLTDGLFPITLGDDDAGTATPEAQEAVVEPAATSEGDVTPEPQDAPEAAESLHSTADEAQAEIPPQPEKPAPKPRAAKAAPKHPEPDIDAIVEKVLDRLWQGSGVDDLVGAVVERIRERLA